MLLKHKISHRYEMKFQRNANIIIYVVILLYSQMIYDELLRLC